MRCIQFLFGFFSLLPALADACSVAKRVPGTRIEAPRAVVEARVVEVRDIGHEYRAGKFVPGQEAVYEVVRSLHGAAHLAGERVTRRHLIQPSACGLRMSVGLRVLLYEDENSEGLQPGGVAWEDESLPGPFGETGDSVEEWRTSPKKQLARVRFRGQVDEEEASHLLRLSRLATDESCDIVVAEHFALIACGRSSAGNDARVKVIFERVDDRWQKVLRYVAPVS